jgi:hypothetical protein
MKKVLLILSLLTIANICLSETLAEWNFDGIDNVSDDTEPPYSANITQHAQLTNATVYHSQPAAALRDVADGYKAIDWEEATDAATSIARGYYLTVQFNIEESYAMDLTGFTVYLEEMVGTGDTVGYAITSSVLGHDASNILASGTLANAAAPTNVSLDLSGGTYDNLNEIEFRIYGWNASGTLVNADGFSIGDNNNAAGDGVADITLSGTVEIAIQHGTLFTVR